MLRAQLEAEIDEEIRAEKEFRPELEAEFGNESKLKQENFIDSLPIVNLDDITKRLRDKFEAEEEEAAIMREIKYLDDLMNMPMPDEMRMELEELEQFMLSLNKEYPNIIEGEVYLSEPTNTMDKIETVDEIKDTKIPNLKQSLNTITRKQIEGMIRSYVEILSSINTLSALKDWTALVFQGKYLIDIRAIISAENSLNDSKEAAINYITNEFIYEVKKQVTGEITPWDFASIRTEMLINLFGPSVTALPITVIVKSNKQDKPNKFTHSLSQDFVFGLLTILDDNKDEISNMFDINLKVEEQLIRLSAFDK